MNWTALEEDLIRDEGLRLRAYYCPAGKKTIGVGHMLRPFEMDMEEISLAEAGRLLRLDIQHALSDLRGVFGSHCLDLWSERRQRALANMMFNLGATRFHGFKKMIAAVKREDWHEAARQCLDSAYAHQVGARAERIAEALREG
jgi:lysozyme